jgi:hypothetical protein
MPSVQLPDHAGRDYLQTFYLARVFITAPTADTPVAIGVGTGLPDDDRVAAAWWVTGIMAGHDIVNMVTMCDLRTAPQDGSPRCARSRSNPRTKGPTYGRCHRSD